MSERYLMALDAGTGAGRCFLIDTEGKKAFSAYREWGMLEDAAAAPFGRSFDPQQYWQCLAESAKEALAKAGIRPDQVIAVSSTSQREGCVFLDRDGHEVYAGPNQDARALGEGFMLMSQFGQRAYEISGHYLNFLFLPARLLWHQSHVPETYERVARIVMINDWILYRLCGECACEPTNAAETAVYNLRTGDWDWSLISDIGLPKEVFPPILPSGHVLGRVSARAAQETGLREGTPVVIGAADTQCGILGAGAIADGDIAAVAGTTTPVQMVLNEVRIDPQTRLWSSAFILPKTWVLESNAGATGIIYRWMRDTFCHAECVEAKETDQDPFVIMSAEAAQSPVGSSGVQAFLGTNIFDAKDVMGVTSALIMNAYTLLGDPRARHHLLRAQLEGMAYAVRANTAQINALAQRKPTRMHVCGGSSKSSLWVNILASVMNLPVVVPAYAEGTAVGAAICAGVGAGAYGDFRQGMEALVKSQRVAEPDSAAVDQYNALYEKWMQVRGVLAQIPVGF
jgi:sugar (pentulose or hexulose) kinase